MSATGALRRAVGILGREPSFRALFFATASSSIGTLVAAVALAVDVKERTGSGTWVGALLIVDFLPAILVGLLLGPLLDRLSRRALMIGADLVRCGIFVALVFVDSALGIVALAAVAGLATGFFRPAVYAGLPNLVPEEDLPAANGLLQGIENVAWTLGPVAGGALVAVASPDVAYWANTVTYLASAVLIIGIPRGLLQSAAALTKGHWRDLADGVAVVVRSRALLTVLVAWSVAMLGSAGVNVAQIFLADDTFDAGSFGYGVLFGAVGLGLVAGSMLAGTVLGDRSPHGIYPAAIGLMAAGFGAAAASPSVWLAAAFAAVGGVGNGIANVCNVLFVQRGAPDELRGRALTLIMSVNYLVLGIGMAISGPLTDAVGPRWVWGASAFLFAAAAVVAALLARGARRETEHGPLADRAPAY
jgi:MFS family permease